MRFRKKKNRHSTFHRSVQYKVICPHVLAQKTRVYERAHIRTHNAAVHQGSRSKVPMQDNKYLSLSLHFPTVVVAAVLPFPFFFFRSQLCCDFRPNGSTLCLNEKNQLAVYGAATLLLCSPPTPSLSMQRKFTSEHIFHFSAVITLPFLVFYQSLILPFVCLYGCQRRFLRVHRRRGRPLHENKS